MNTYTLISFVVVFFVAAFQEVVVAFTCEKKDIFGNTFYLTCPSPEDKPTAIYCCGTSKRFRYCCDQSIHGDTIRSVGVIIGVFVSIVVALVVIIIVSCFCCSCCLLAKRRQQRGRVLYGPSTNTPSSGVTYPTQNQTGTSPYPQQQQQQQQQSYPTSTPVYQQQQQNGPPPPGFNYYTASYPPTGNPVLPPYDQQPPPYNPAYPSK